MQNIIPTLFNFDANRHTLWYNLIVKYFKWNADKDLHLLLERNISFEDVIFNIENGGLLDVIQHPNQERYPNQRILIVNVDNYAYLVPFVEQNDVIFLKTIIPSRKATKIYLGSNYA